MAYDVLCQRFRDLCAAPKDPALYIDFLKQTQNASLETQSCILEAMLECALPCPVFPEAIDVCGTGGSGLHKRNISTAVAFVLASLGVPVSKHANRSATSKSGSADVWDCLGLPFLTDPVSLKTLYDRHHLAFVFAPLMHPALAHFAAARKALGVPTVFNRLGPLANPTRPNHQLLGVSQQGWLSETASLLQKRSIRRAWVVYGDDGSDDIALHHPTTILDVSPRGILPLRLDPKDFPFVPADPEGLRGGSPEDNAQALLALLQGKTPDDAYGQSVTINAAAGLIITGHTSSLTEGCDRVQRALREGKPYALYQAMKKDLSSL
ncbi:MAG: anthranilate phosphoribosyltransferase [Alphaproteobacteria bacterium]